MRQSDCRARRARNSKQPQGGSPISSAITVTVKESKTVLWPCILQIEAVSVSSLPKVRKRENPAADLVGDVDLIQAVPNRKKSHSYEGEGPSARSSNWGQQQNDGLYFYYMWSCAERVMDRAQCGGLKVDDYFGLGGSERIVQISSRSTISMRGRSTLIFATLSALFPRAARASVLGRQS